MDFVAGLDACLFDALPKTPEIKIQAIERQNAVYGKLAGGVAARSPAAADPADIESRLGENLPAFPDVGPTRIGPERDDGRVLAQKHAPHPILPSGKVVNHSLLQRKNGIEVHQAKQVDFERILRLSSRNHRTVGMTSCFVETKDADGMTRVTSPSPDHSMVPCERRQFAPVARPVRFSVSDRRETVIPAAGKRLRRRRLFRLVRRERGANRTSRSRALPLSPFEASVGSIRLIAFFFGPGPKGP